MRKGYLAVHIALFLYSGAFVTLHATGHRQIPAPPPAIHGSDSQRAANADDRATPTTDPIILRQTQESRFPHLGAAELFATLIPKPPTPPPTPPPTIPPAPVLQITPGWRLVAVLPGGQASFEDRKTGEEWAMRVGEKRAVKFRATSVDIRLAHVNETDFSAGLATDLPGEDQSRTLTLF